jgi:hypothetical protein
VTISSVAHMLILCVLYSVVADHESLLRTYSQNSAPFGPIGGSWSDVALQDALLAVLAQLEPQCLR